MQTYHVELIAMAAAMLGRSNASAGICAAMPDIVHHVSSLTRQTIAESVAEQTEGRIVLQLNFANEIETHKEVAETLIHRFRPEYRQCLEEALGASDKMRLPPRWQAKRRRVLESFDTKDARTIKVLIEELYADLEAELTEPLFLYVSPEKRARYDKPEDQFGDTISRAFPGAQRDLCAASRCLALDEWTACVFHLMRAVEHALHALARKLGVEFPRPIEFQHWKNIVDKIDSTISDKVKRLEQTAPSVERSAELKAYRDASIQLRHFKNAWRNDAAHAREHYDSREAEKVFLAVVEFMRTMTAVVRVVEGDVTSASPKAPV